MDSSLSIPEVFVYLVIYLRNVCWSAGGQRCLYSQIHNLRFSESKGFSLVYLQAFQECINIIVVSATTF